MDDSGRIEDGWVIEEKNSEVCTPFYFAGLIHGDRITFEWSQDNMHAVRFARKWDAARVAGNLGHRICDHQWGG